MVTCKECMKKSNLEKFENAVHLEEEGRPRNSWMKEVTTGMREKGFSNMESIDREERRNENKQA